MNVSIVVYFSQSHKHCRNTHYSNKYTDENSPTLEYMFV